MVVLSANSGGYRFPNLERETRQDFARANFVRSILAPRIFRVGAKVNF